MKCVIKFVSIILFHVRNVSTTKDFAVFKFTLFLSIRTTKCPKEVNKRERKKPAFKAVLSSLLCPVLFVLVL